MRPHEIPFWSLVVLFAVRQKKAVAVFPRPTAGPLRPVVHSQTLKYNSKIRAGRGFTLEELKVLFPLWHKAYRVLFLCDFCCNAWLV
jgi:ribosomal protein L13E